MRILLFLLIFILVGMLFIISNNNLAMIKQENISTFNRIYFSYLSDIFQNIMGISGNVVKLEWLPNSTVNPVNQSKF